ncbi:MAG: ABC transporter permease [Erysipelotrichaceae bacterium]|nr:ABC transporter permease [Erysipelotrichaceae bacterium]MBQ1323877.1 ABC transporter permease [Erysipelotrichaceae bacterium]MBQ1346709.1 ABC transporter permease [Erysipelotrichaceae bacterium]MBQ1380293.1 ABC transporter permease [Erysipelotrichaceae bacterium]MBQ1740323.1 ABC transporter permease [Erysipelotrichaceae bacterium]
MSEKNLVLTDDLFEKLPEEEKNSEFIAVAIKTFAKDAWDRFRKNKLALAGLIFLIVMILLAIIVPQVAPYKFDTQDMANRNAMPSLQHLFGTDKLGRDIFVRVMYGARVSLAIGFSTAAINLVIGILYGGISGYVGGRVDMIMMRIVDIIYAVPSLIYVVLILLVFGDSIGSMMLAICLTSWIGMARQVRTQIMSLKEMEFSLAAKVIGASNTRILLRHLIINALGPIIVSLTMMVPGAIFTEASLSFVGIGLNPAIPSWGKLANDCRQLIFTQPIQVIWPVAAISLTILALNFVGDGIGEAFQARTR